MGTLRRRFSFCLQHRLRLKERETLPLRRRYIRYNDTQRSLFAFAAHSKKTNYILFPALQLWLRISFVVRVEEDGRKEGIRIWGPRRAAFTRFASYTLHSMLSYVFIMRTWLSAQSKTSARTWRWVRWDGIEWETGTHDSACNRHTTYKYLPSDP
jgi:hypothetical protein